MQKAVDPSASWSRRWSDKGTFPLTAPALEDSDTIVRDDFATERAEDRVDEDAEERQAKTTQLRNARLEREANTPSETKTTLTRKTR